MQWYLIAFKKYGVFSGRSRRKEYWMFILFNMFAAFGIALLEAALFGVPEKGEYGPISALYMVAIILPSISIAVRRLHDTNHSGWWILINMIPLVGGFWFLWLMCKDSDHETNRFGDDPTAEGIVKIASEIEINKIIKPGK